MADDWPTHTEIVRKRLEAVFWGFPPDERHERFLTLLHGEGWQERARAPDAPLILIQALRILDLDKRLRQIEDRIALEPSRGPKD